MDDRGAWLSDNEVYQNVRNTLTYTEVPGLEASDMVCPASDMFNGSTEALISSEKVADS